MPSIVLPVAEMFVAGHPGICPGIHAEELQKATLIQDRSCFQGNLRPRTSPQRTHQDGWVSRV